MGYASLREAARDLESHGMLARIKEPVDPNLEMAEIHRRVFERQGPALLFERVIGSPFQAISNVYGTIDRTEFLFRDTLPRVKKVIELKADPANLLKNPLRYLGAPFTALKGLPMRSFAGTPSMYGETRISQLPQIKSWPMDGGAFITLPQVLSLDPENPSLMRSNIGMYRIQLSGNQYVPDEEIGMHYQIHRGIGVHHEGYNRLNKPFKVSIFVGGPPSHAFAAIMPLPEGLSEMTFAGMLAGRRFRYRMHNGHVISSDADFVITGEIVRGFKKPEGPFGDHLGYYSLEHDFPVMRVEKVYHRKDPLWHFTVVGRPPAEDSSFGHLIHKLVETLTPQEFPGLKDLNAVDAAGVHPLLLATGYERYMPFRESKPEEILTIANRILGSGQTSLAKFLFIAAANDHPQLSSNNIPAFLEHVLQRVDWNRDLHFQTNTTIDTLDYSGNGWNAGSKVVIACCGPVRRNLGRAVPSDLRLPEFTGEARIALPGVLCIGGSGWSGYAQAETELKQLTDALELQNLDDFPLIVLCDDPAFTAASVNNFVWVTFTRANPSHDLYGVGEFIRHKHWGCRGPLIIDARKKKHHAPELIPDKKVSEKVDKLFAKGGPLHFLD
jgi:4-hydroxy-3-polyprenylbenzoate decarboxylase